MKNWAWIGVLSLIVAAPSATAGCGKLLRKHGTYHCICFDRKLRACIEQGRLELSRLFGGCSAFPEDVNPALTAVGTGLNDVMVTCIPSSITASSRGGGTSGGRIPAKDSSPAH